MNLSYSLKWETKVARHTNCNTTRFFTPMELAPRCSADLRFAWSKYTCPLVVEAPCSVHLTLNTYFSFNQWNWGKLQ